MSVEPKDKPVPSEQLGGQPVEDWQPSTTMTLLKKRAALLSNIRAYFNRLNVLEVETPLLSAGTVTDPALAPLYTEPRCIGQAKRYLQTSPEFHMKRLLASGSGSIFQISKAFRDDEIGQQHNPEFTMLEWYRVGLDYQALIGEIDSLLSAVGVTMTSHAVTYRALFFEHCQLNPHTATTAELIERAQDSLGKQIEGLTLDNRSDWLDLIFSHIIQPNLGKSAPIFVYDYPACQAALAKTAILDDELGNDLGGGKNHYRVAQRFELFYKGIELANGYQELTDAKELEHRLYRESSAHPERTLDRRLIAAQHAGLPECSGVALGIDRLMMTLYDLPSIKATLSFDFNRA